MIKLKVQIIKDLQNFLYQADNEKSKYTTYETAFTKPKKLSFILTILFLLNMPRKSLGLEIECFFRELGKADGTCTKSAMSQARYKLKPTIFIEWNKALQQSYYKRNRKSIATWDKYELHGVDGSTLHLMNMEEIRKEFGCQPNQHGGVPMARILIRQDVLNEVIISAQIEPMKKGEKEMAISELDNMPENVISIYDRNFTSFEFIYEHLHRELHFIVRSKIGFNNIVKAFVESEKKTEHVVFHATSAAISNLKKKGISITKKDLVKIRLIRVELNTGETEILITSLMDEKEFPSECFGELYNLRWGTETCFDALKNKLQIAAFSGHTAMAIKQDFHATIFVANLNAILIQDCNKEVEQISMRRKYNYKINRNISIGVMKDDIVKMFLIKNEELGALLNSIKVRFIRHVEPVRPGRSYERKYKTNARRSKYHTLTNYRRAI